MFQLAKRFRVLQTAEQVDQFPVQVVQYLDRGWWTGEKQTGGPHVRFAVRTSAQRHVLHQFGNHLALATKPLQRSTQIVARHIPATLSVKGCVIVSGSANNIVSSYVCANDIANAKANARAISYAVNNAKVNVKVMAIASATSYVFVCARANATDQAVANAIANASSYVFVAANANARDTATV